MCFFQPTLHVQVSNATILVSCVNPGYSTGPADAAPGQGLTSPPHPLDVKSITVEGETEDDGDSFLFGILRGERL